LAVALPDQAESLRILAQRTAETRAKRAGAEAAEADKAMGRHVPAMDTFQRPSERYEAEQAASRLQQQVEACLARCKLPPRWANAEFRPSPDCLTEAERCRYTKACLDMWGLLGEGGCWMVALVGPRGDGKSEMAAALVRAFCLRGRWAVFSEAGDYFLELDHAREMESRSALLVEADYLKPDVLVLDAMEERATTEAKDRMLTRLIRKRHDALKRTLMVSNETPDQFKARVGETIADRIHDGGGVIECDWPSLRGRIQR